MINLKNKTIEIDGVISPIARFEVWFQTPFGIVKGYDAAKKIVEECDLDPDLTLLPVPVAIGENFLFEICLRT